MAELLLAGSAMAKLLAGSAMTERMAALWRSAIGKKLLARGAASELHREEATAGKGRYCRKGRKSHCWKGEILLERGDTAGKENHCRKEEPLPER